MATRKTMTTDTRIRRQLPLPFGTPGLTDGLPPFLAAPSNEDARHMVAVWQDSLNRDTEGAPEGHGILIAGAEGAGKSLLLAYLARDAGVPVHGPKMVADKKSPLPDDAVIMVDDIHQCPASDIFRLYNACLERRRPFVLAGRGNPRDWAGDGAEELPDLASRLSATPAAILEKPEEAQMAAAIQAMLAVRQIRISEEAAAQAAHKLKRSYHAVARFVEMLDSEALERQKAIDKALVQSVLGRIPEAVL